MTEQDDEVNDDERGDLPAEPRDVVTLHISAANQESAANQDGDNLEERLQDFELVGVDLIRKESAERIGKLAGTVGFFLGTAAAGIAAWYKGASQEIIVGAGVGIGAAAGLILGKIAGGITKRVYKEIVDKDFRKKYGFYATPSINGLLVRADEDLSNPLEQVYKDALVLDDLLVRLGGKSKKYGGALKFARENALETISKERKHLVDRAIADYLRKLKDYQLEVYIPIFDASNFIRLANFYIDQGRLEDTENLVKSKEFGESGHDSRSWLNHIAQERFNDGDYRNTERLWKETGNVHGLKTYLLPVYIEEGRHDKIAEIRAFHPESKNPA